MSGSDAPARLRYICDTVTKISKGKIKLEFDITLVRGQGYYTGTVFEVRSDEFSGAIAGGGRYDNLIGRFIGEDIPAVGFSIGFERIFSILKDRGGFTVPGGRKKLVIMYDPENFAEAEEKAEQLRGDYDVALCRKTKKTGKILSRYAQRGYDAFISFGQSDEIQPLY